MKNTVELEILYKKSIEGSVVLNDEQRLVLNEKRFLRNVDSLQFNLIRPNNIKVKNSIVYKIERFWNSLPLETRCSRSKDIFKNDVTKLIKADFFGTIILN